MNKINNLMLISVAVSVGIMMLIAMYLLREESLKYECMADGNNYVNNECIKVK